LAIGAPEPRFWSEVTSKLKRLGDRVGPEDYERIIASIAAKVGSPLFSSQDMVAGIARGARSRFPRASRCGGGCSKKGRSSISAWRLRRSLAWPPSVPNFLREP
jgi:hypothetical protein